MKYTDKDDLIVDPFCGCGSIALEAAANHRCIVAGDWNPYAVLLTRAKLFPPSNLEAAEKILAEAWKLSQREYLSRQDLRKVPSWVRGFFAPNTLRSALAFRDACCALSEDFLLACLLGILHHQRPGFLSYPSSHLVPYLRDRKFPRKQFPELYMERSVLPRLEKKVRRTFRRFPYIESVSKRVLRVDARSIPRIQGIRAVITSPPYMNELDYVRDNRLRLWFLERSLPLDIEMNGHDRDLSFRQLIRTTSIRLAPGIKPGGYFIFVVGDATRGRSPVGRTAALTYELFSTEPELQTFTLDSLYEDKIPDIRRSRRKCRGTRLETVLVFRRVG